MNQSSDAMFQAALKRGIQAAEREDFYQALQILSGIYTEHSEDPVDGLSYYALCLALVERKYKPAIKMCERAVSVQFYNAGHYANSVRVFMAAGNRRLAVRVLEDGLKNLPKDPLLLQIRTRIGYRRGNVVPFLHRDNPLNVWLGRRRTLARLKAGGDVGYAAAKKRRRGILYYLMAILAALAYLAGVVGLFFWIAE